MNVPYTTKTGLKIGSRYQENGIKMPIDDPDMLFLQTILICPKVRRQEMLDDLVYKIAIVLLLGIVFFKLICR
jgi:hypothetical protein